MLSLTRLLAATAVGIVLSTGAFAQEHAHNSAASQLIPIENEAAPKLIVDAPLAGPLARGAVLIPYRVENIRILPVVGAAADNISPRVGHLHVTVDDLPWHWADFSNSGTVVVVGLPVGAHKVRIDLAGPEHRVYEGQTVTFNVPVQAVG